MVVLHHVSLARFLPRSGLNAPNPSLFTPCLPLHKGYNFSGISSAGQLGTTLHHSLAIRVALQSGWRELTAGRNPWKIGDGSAQSRGHVGFIMI
ncbi:hypothetical protein HOY82DRAFT_145185 [Tuber indicum]|nr:hypothetical protein HOY82DRAFT_145185 [Tuber indicum]